MIRGIGADLCAVVRVERLLGRWGERLRGRVFSEAEWVEAARRPESLAARWAAKEAFGKALGTGFQGFRAVDVEVSRPVSGRPVLVLSGRGRQTFERAGGGVLHLTLGHEAGMALAFVVWEGE